MKTPKRKSEPPKDAPATGLGRPRRTPTNVILHPHSSSKSGMMRNHPISTTVQALWMMMTMMKIGNCHHHHVVNKEELCMSNMQTTHILRVSFIIKLTEESLTSFKGNARTKVLHNFDGAKKQLDG